MPLMTVPAAIRLAVYQKCIQTINSHSRRSAAVGGFRTPYRSRSTTIDHPDPVVIVGDSSGVDPDNGSLGAVEYRSRCSQVRCRWKKSTLT